MKKNQEFGSCVNALALHVINTPVQVRGKGRKSVR